MIVRIVFFSLYLLLFSRYFQAGGIPEQVIDLLSKNYIATAQMANMLAEWLISAGVSVTSVQAMVENHLKDMVLKTFDPKKADTIFTEDLETSWLSSMIRHPTWRSLIYRLAEEYPDCLMLNFTIKVIINCSYIPKTLLTFIYFFFFRLYPMRGTKGKSQVSQLQPNK